MKSVKKQGIERFNEKEFDKMSELVGGITGPIFRTATYRGRTRSSWLDKDNELDTALPDSLTL
jgi:hypothetical protein